MHTLGKEVYVGGRDDCAKELLSLRLTWWRYHLFLRDCKVCTAVQSCLIVSYASDLIYHGDEKVCGMMCENISTKRHI